MLGNEPERSEINQIFRELFSSKMGSVVHGSHPSAETLRLYLLGKIPLGWNDPSTQIEALQDESIEVNWNRTAVTAHLISCRACQDEIETIRSQVSSSPGLAESMKSVFNSIRERLERIPRPALATIAAQAVIIVVLGVLALSNGLFSPNGASALSNGLSHTLPEPQQPINSAQAASDLMEQFYSASESDKTRMAREFSKNNDITILPYITEMMQDVESDETLRLLGQAFNNSLSAINDTLEKTVEQIDEYRTNSKQFEDFPDPRMMEQLQNGIADLNRAVRKLNLSADIDVLTCSPTSQMLDLVALDPILARYAGVLVYDATTENRFEVQLPPLFTSQAQPLLMQAGLACRL